MKVKLLRAYTAKGKTVSSGTVDVPKKEAERLIKLKAAIPFREELPERRIGQTQTFGPNQGNSGAGGNAGSGSGTEDETDPVKAGESSGPGSENETKESDLLSLQSIDEAIAGSLSAAGFGSINSLKTATAEELTKIEGMAPEMVNSILAELDLFHD